MKGYHTDTISVRNDNLRANRILYDPTTSACLRSSLVTPSCALPYSFRIRPHRSYVHIYAKNPMGMGSQGPPYITHGQSSQNQEPLIAKA